MAFIRIFQAGIEDMWLWHLYPSKKYNVSNTYNYLSSTENNITYDSSDIIWHKVVSLKVNLFVRRLL